MIPAFDMFCGAGGSSAGAQAAGAQIVAGVDMCSIAASTFAANFPEARIISDRLEDVDLGSLKVGSRRNRPSAGFSRVHQPYLRQGWGSTQRGKPSHGNARNRIRQGVASPLASS